jgi:hypothetical protein
MERSIGKIKGSFRGIPTAMNGFLRSRVFGGHQPGLDTITWPTDKDGLSGWNHTWEGRMALEAAQQLLDAGEIPVAQSTRNDKMEI